MQFENVPVRDIMHGLLGKDIYIENDANAAALGEALAGCRQGCSKCSVHHFGHPVWAAELSSTAGFTAASISLAQSWGTSSSTKAASCAVAVCQGCWEAYASATALVNQTRRAMVNHPESKMWEIAGDLDKVDGRTAFDGMRAEDARCLPGGGYLYPAYRLRPY